MCSQLDSPPGDVLGGRELLLLTGDQGEVEGTSILLESELTVVGAELTPTSHPLSLSGQTGAGPLAGTHPSPVWSTSFHAKVWAPCHLGLPALPGRCLDVAAGDPPERLTAQNRKPRHRGPCFFVAERNTG